MEKNLKELLLKDLCARLPYGICANLPNHHLVSHKYVIYDINIQNEWTTGLLDCAGRTRIYSAKVEDIKPYLRSLSSMTEEEKKEMSILLNYEFYIDDDYALVPKYNRHRIELDLMKIYIDWLNKKMFAYRNIDGKDMFELGIAIKVTEENNPYKK